MPFNYQIPNTRGINSPGAVLDDDIVREIRRLRDDEKKGPAEISRQLGLKTSTVDGVYYNRRWTHVKRLASVASET